jgi:FecR protein
MPRATMCQSLLRKPVLLLSILFTLLLSLATTSRAQDLDEEDGHDSHARIVRISYIEGEVRLDNGHGYENATMNMPVTERNWLQTRSDGWAEIQLEDGSLVRLAPDTVISFTELGRLSSGGTVTTIDLDQGEAAFKVIKHDGSDFQITVKNKTITLQHSGSFRVTSTNADPMEIVVWKGEVSVRDPESGGEVAVKKNESFVLDPSDVGRYALDKGAEADGLDEWSKQRDDYLSTYAAAGHNYSQSPYQYGASDLDYYGSYFDAPGYGQVWQPNGVGLNWDPFGNGYWAYSPGFGYTWVSSYPWGWMPYRYGRWVFVNGRGWCWAPGGWNRWYSRPRWAHAPPGFRPPIPPATHPVVGGSPGEWHPGGSGRNGGSGGRGSGPAVGGRPGDRDGDNRNPGQHNGNRGDRRVLTNDDVQGRVPRTDVPAQNQPPAPVTDDRKPRVVVQEPAGGAGGGREHETGRFGGDRVPRTPVNHGNEAQAPPPSQPVRQSGPPPQSYSPPNRQPEHLYTPPPQQPAQPAQSAPPARPSAPPPPPPPAVHQSAPPAAAPAQQAPRQSSPQAESRTNNSDDSSRGRPK